MKRNDCVIRYQVLSYIFLSSCCSQETSRQRYEDRKLYMETLQRHENQRVSERQFHDMKSSMEYDNDWLLKMHRGRSSRMVLFFGSVISVIMQAHFPTHVQHETNVYRLAYKVLSLSVIVMIVAEVYFSLPPDTSTVAFISFLLVRSLSHRSCMFNMIVMSCAQSHLYSFLFMHQGCECSVTDTDISVAPTCWSLAWVSGYCTAPFASSFETPLCYAKCITWHLLPPFCIQVVLNFCKCPRLIHQGVTLLTIVSLLAPQLEDAVSTFAWYRVLPLFIVTLACVARTWIRSSVLHYQITTIRREYAKRA